MKSFNCRVWLLIFLAVTFMACREKGESVAPPELKYKIVYVSEEGICTINPDATERKVIVPIEKGGPFSNPKWSPDKRRIAFTGHLEASTRIMLVDSDGSHRKVIGLPEGPKRKSKRGEQYVSLGKYNLEFLGWSSSGKYLLYIPGLILDATIFGVISTKGKVIAQLGGVDPSFTGEDSIIFVASGISKTTGVETKIVRYDLKKNKRQILTQGEGVFYYSPSFSPRVDKIAYGIDSVALYNELWIMNSDGSGGKRIAAQNYDFVGKRIQVIEFSQDGKNILFLPDNGYKSSIYVVKTDGTGLYAVTSDIVNAKGGASWSPDGNKIVFTSNKDGNNELYIVNVDGTALRRLTNNNFNNCCPDW